MTEPDDRVSEVDYSLIDLNNCTFQAVCCVCKERYGPHTKVNHSHGYCDVHGAEVLEQIRSLNKEKRWK